MTEAEWMACEDPMPMLDWLGAGGTASDRQLRLWSCACVRRIWPTLPDGRCRKVVEAAERFADGRADEGDLTALVISFEGDARAVGPALAYLDSHTLCIPSHARHDALRAARFRAAGNTAWTQAGFAVPRARLASRYSACVAAWKDGEKKVSVPFTKIRAALQAERLAHCNLLRDILGPLPFRPVALDPAPLAWNDGTVPKIAQGIYEERAFGRLPILSDALLDAGCDDEELIGHCRSEGPHVRGCWAVDLILGKS